MCNIIYKGEDIHIPTRCFNLHWPTNIKIHHSKSLGCFSSHKLFELLSGLLPLNAFSANSSSGISIERSPVTRFFWLNLCRCWKFGNLCDQTCYAIIIHTVAKHSCFRVFIPTLNVLLLESFAWITNSDSCHIYSNLPPWFPWQSLSVGVVEDLICSFSSLTSHITHYQWWFPFHYGPPKPLVPSLRH